MTMFSVVQYNNYHKEVDFKIHMVTNDIEETKTIAFQHSVKLLKGGEKTIQIKIINASIK
jgi:hypothetical protein